MKHHMTRQQPPPDQGEVAPVATEQLVLVGSQIGASRGISARTPTHTRNTATGAPTYVSKTSALAPIDLRHELERRRRGRTPEVEASRETVAENKDPWEAQLEELRNQIKSMHRDHQMQAPAVVEAMMEETEPPFTSEIMDSAMSSRFRMPPIIQYSGSGDPTEHMESYCSWMQIQSTSEVMMCKAFSITLTGVARSWYRQLKPKLINMFAMLSKAFLTQFIVEKKSRKPSTHLLTLKQKSGESLKDYISRFNEEALQVDDYFNKMALTAMISGLKDGRFLFSIGKNPLATLSDLINRAQKYTNAEEFFSCEKVPKAQSIHPKTRSARMPHSNLARARRDPIGDPRQKAITLVDLHEDGSRSARQAQILSLSYHGHNTSDCIDLKEIETLIRKGHLCQYIKEERQARKDEQPGRARDDGTKIRMIYGGPSGGSDSNQARKAHARSIYPEHYIHLANRPRKELQVSTCNLTFTEDDACGIQHPHDNALVVTMTISNRKVYCILVDTGSTVDILYSEAFNKIGIDRSCLRPIRTPLHGFAGDKVISKGTISLPVKVGEGQNQVTLLVDFLVVHTVIFE
ncbi:uncharacterized protein LOC131226876 [Magnolia sinica]|uniref:uncharacterized protein LOC131226876 n=1 Tax=Magnolia sinica TaxID=86752 RepID=UPI00265959B6|nr:uncharacterized protein LOC131226876 [Magnolia sinica]